MKYKRPTIHTLMQRLSEPRRFIQVLAGPRQSGKTTLARQLIEMIDIPVHYAAADEPALKDRHWLEQQWETGRHLVESKQSKAVLILDEIQKITGWSETVKRLWDEDHLKGLDLYVMLLGSAPLLVQRGLSESLAGRFEMIRVTHWTYPEMNEAFGWDVDTYVFYGGYPGAATLIGDQQRWSNYLMDSLIETTVSRDILLLHRVDKPALLRRLFELGCLYSGQILSYQKMLGQLQEAGNTTTLAHYLNLLNGAGLITGLPKYAGQQVRQRASSPKLLVLNTALMSVFTRLTFEKAKQDSQIWGRMIESAVGASLANGVMGRSIELFYWSSRNREVDFVLARGNRLIAIEVKSSYRKPCFPGIEPFSKEFPLEKKLLVGGDGIPLADFLKTPVESWFE